MFHQWFSLSDERYDLMQQTAQSRKRKERKRERKEKREKQTSCCSNDWITESVVKPLTWPLNIQLHSLFLSSRLSSVFFLFLTLRHQLVANVYMRELSRNCTLFIYSAYALRHIYDTRYTGISLFFSLKIDRTEYKTYWNKWNERIHRYTRFTACLSSFYIPMFSYIYLISNTYLCVCLQT